MRYKNFILVIILILLIPTSTIHAAPAAQELPIFYSGTTDFARTKIGGTEALEVFAGNFFGVQLQDIIMPIYNKLKQIAAPDLKPLGVGTMQTYNQYLISDALNDKIIHYTDINENIASSLFCAIITNHSKYSSDRVDVMSTGLQRSSNIEHSQEAFENGRKANAVYGRQEVEPNEAGFLDFNLGAVYHNAGSVRCDVQLPSTIDKPVENNVRQLSSWGGGGTDFATGTVWETLWDEIIQILQDGSIEVIQVLAKFFPKYEVRLTENTTFSNGQELGHYGDPTGNEVAKSPHENTKKLGDTRGLAFAYLPEERADDPNIHAGTTEYSYNVKGMTKHGDDAFGDKNGGVEHPWLLVNNAKFRACQMARTVVPDGYTGGKAIGDGSEGDIVLDEKCPDIKPLQCPIQVIKENANKPSDNKCTIANQSSAKQFMSADQQTAFGAGLSPLAIKVLETAADTYNVPASVLLATMYHEGAFNHAGVWNWSDDATIEKYSDCNNPEPIPSCTEFGGSEGAVGPFGFIIDPWWNKYMESGNPYQGKFLKTTVEGLDEVVKALDPKSFNPCNFTDAAFMAAREISEDQSHAYETVPNSCVSSQFGTINFYTGGDRPTSCAAWTPERVATTRLQYAEGIDEGACTPEGDMFTNDIGRMVKMYQTLTP